MDLLARYSKSVVGLILVVSLFSCKGAGNNADGGGGAANPAATGSFIGKWAGKYVNKDNSTSLSETPVQASFESNDAKTGTFRFDLTQIQNAFATGTYTILDQVTLMLDIKQSTVSSIGMSGTKNLITYHLLGNSLELSNEQVKMVFAPDKSAETTPSNREAQAPPPSNTGNATTGGPSDPLFGPWLCFDKAGNRWQMNLQQDSGFYIEVYSATGQRGSIWLSGTLKITRATGKPDADLVVENSSVAKYQGMELQLFMKGVGNLQLVRVASGEELPCIRS